MATAPHQVNRRLKPAQAAPRHRTLAINSDRVRKPIIRPSCLGEFEWPQVGEFEAAIGVIMDPRVSVPSSDPISEGRLASSLYARTT